MTKINFNCNINSKNQPKIQISKTNIFKCRFGNLKIVIAIDIAIKICYLIIRTFISSTFLSDKIDGAPNNKSSLEPVFGKAITSLIDAFFSKTRKIKLT